MTSILKIPLLQYASHQSDVKIYVTDDYRKKIDKLNSDLYEILCSANKNTNKDIKEYLDKEYDSVVDFIKFLIYTHLPFSNLNRDYNLDINKIMKIRNEKLVLNSIILKLNDIINVKINIMIKINQNIFIDFNLKKEDNEEILDTISRNFWFEKRESNYMKLHGLKNVKKSYLT